jgi:hypothetical protein
LITALNQHFGLATVFTLPRGQESLEVAATWVQDQIARYSREDDVFDEHFLSTVIFHSGSGSSSSEDEEVEFTEEARVYLQGRGTERVIIITEPQLLPGPYAIVGSHLRDVWKLVDDINGTCMVTLNPQQK